MEGTIFVNEAFTDAIKKYLDNKNTPESKEYNSFLVVVIRTLTHIYGELDIINPYRTNNVAGLDENLKKFGLSDDKLVQLKNEVLMYHQNEGNIPALKSSFLKIQRILVDTFILKKSHVLISDEEVEVFRNLLYFKGDANSIKLELYNLLTPYSNEIVNYLNSKLFELKHSFVLTESKDIVLSQEAYQLAGYNIVEVMNMSEQEIENVNNKVYHFFRIKDSDLNKKKRLESAISYYKKYGNTVTSGNGYVDMLLLAGIVATGLMMAVMVAIRLAG